MFKIKCNTLEEAVKRYGTISPGKWADELKWMTVWDAPDCFENQVLNGLTGKPCKRIYMNKDMVEPFTAVVKTLEEKGLLKHIKSFDGCFILRDKRGLPGQPSTHSYGLAIDLNATTNALGTDGDMNKEVVKVFIDHGFIWGGSWKRKDPMHFQFVGF